MDILTVPFYYLKWHYSSAIAQGYSIWKNVMWFLYHFFSIPLLLRTFFDQFERLGVGYKKGLYIGENFSVLIVNTLMRLVGMGVRSIVLLIGFITLVLTFFAGIFVFFFWLLFPAIVFCSFVIGLYKIL